MNHDKHWIHKGSRFVAYPDRRPADRLYIEITRAARDGSWADIFICNWAVSWSKRQAVKDGRLPEAVPYEWDERDLFRQEFDWSARMREATDQ